MRLRMRLLFVISKVTKRMDFYGPAVNRAARVEGQAEGGQFLICETTYLHTVSSSGHHCSLHTSFLLLFFW
jgi:class 3 adenylate cyclase